MFQKLMKIIKIRVLHSYSFLGFQIFSKAMTYELSKNNKDWQEKKMVKRTWGELSET